jgi:hypothetical protein
MCLLSKKEGRVRTTNSSRLKRNRKAEIKISYNSLPGLLPGNQLLALNLETRTLSLLSDGPLLIMEQQFSVNEIRVISPILDAFPHYSPYEVLLDHLSSDNVSATSIARWQQRLQEAQRQGSWRHELRPLRRALSSLRSKLHYFDLEITNIRERGCSLTSLSSS